MPPSYCSAAQFSAIMYLLLRAIVAARPIRASAVNFIPSVRVRWEPPVEAFRLWSPQMGCLRLPVPSLAVLRLTGARFFDCATRIFAARFVLAVPPSLFDDLACLT